MKLSLGYITREKNWDLRNAVRTTCCRNLMIATTKGSVEEFRLSWDYLRRLVTKTQSNIRRRIAWYTDETVTSLNNKTAFYFSRWLNAVLNVEGHDDHTHVMSIKIHNLRCMINQMHADLMVLIIPSGQPCCFSSYITSYRGNAFCAARLIFIY